MGHVVRKQEMHTKCLWKNLKERNLLEVKHIYERIVLRRILNKQHWREWTGLIWLRMGTSGWLV
jgi:hypothetical protein